MVSTNFAHLFLVTLDSPEGTDVVSVDEAVILILSTREGEAADEGSQQQLPGDTHN